jgi:hypothetical protein
MHKYSWLFDTSCGIDAAIGNSDAGRDQPAHFGGATLRLCPTDYAGSTKILEEPENSNSIEPVN